MVIDWKSKYSTLAAWSQVELASICCGLNPDETKLSINDLRGRVSEQVDMMFFWQHNKEATLEMIERSVRCKELVPAYQNRGVKGLFVNYFKREDAIRWALSTGLFPEFPFSLADLPPCQNPMIDEKHNPANAANEDPRDSLASRERTTYANIIGGLLSLLLGQKANGDPISSYSSQAEIIADLVDRFPTANGISKSNLESKFADANRAIKQT